MVTPGFQLLSSLFGPILLGVIYSGTGEERKRAGEGEMNVVDLARVRVVLFDAARICSDLYRGIDG